MGAQEGGDWWFRNRVVPRCLRGKQRRSQGLQEQGGTDECSFLSSVAMTQLATVARDCSLKCIYYNYTMCGVLRRPKKAGEERLEASLRRRCRYQRCSTLRVTDWVGRVDGGRIELPFAIQSDGLGVDSAIGSCSRGAGSAVAAGVAGVGGDSDDLKLSSRQGGDELC